MHHPLVNASPEQVGQIAIQMITGEKAVRSGTPKLVLAQRTTWDKIASLGLGCQAHSSLETPPLMLIILKGDFDASNQLGMSMAGPNPQFYVTYILYVYDLWAGQPTFFMFSPDGRGLGKALNDPTLPEPTDPSAQRPDICPTPTLDAPQYTHYGDTVSGGAPGTSVHSGNFGSWWYEATTHIPASIRTEEEQPLASNQIYAKVTFDGSSMASIQSYIDANKQLLTQMAGRTGQVEISVVFKDYVLVDQFRAFAQAHQLKTGVSYLRAIDEDPNPQYAPYYTIHIVGHQDVATPLPQADLDNIYGGIKKYVPQLSLKGVYATHAWVDAKELPALAADPSVYYVDLAATAVRDDLAKAEVAGAAQAVVDTPAHLIFVAVFEQSKSK